MKRLIPALTLAAALLTAGPCVADAMTGWRVQAAPTVGVAGGYGLTVKEIDFRNDLTRVRCTISGRPNTSSRISGVTLDGHPATDIDGIDLGRYFQFEESGLIDLEIDFPAIKPARTTELKFITPSGPLTYTLRR